MCPRPSRDDDRRDRERVLNQTNLQEAASVVLCERSVSQRVLLGLDGLPSGVEHLDMSMPFSVYQLWAA